MISVLVAIGEQNYMALLPWRTTVTIDGNSFGANSVGVGFSTQADRSGSPVMGSLQTSIDVSVDIHDDVNMPFDSLRKLFDLANVVTKDKIKDIKIEFWKDENRQDVVCSYRLKGWISHWQTHSNGDNHTLVMSIQPSMNQDNFSTIMISN